MSWPSIARSPTLVKDVGGIFPLDPAKTKRILFVDGGINHPLIPHPLQFVLPDLLRKEGFEVTIDRPDIVPSPDDFDLVLYALGDESLLVRGRIFVDWLRNARGATSVASYSLRARAGAPVAMPLEWSELARLRSSDAYTLRNALRKIRSRRRDPWRELYDLEQTLPGPAARSRRGR